MLSLLTQMPETVIYRSYDEIQVGGSYSSSGRTITETDVLLFSALIGGFHNAVHHNVPWIKANTEFKDKLFP